MSSLSNLFIAFLLISLMACEGDTTTLKASAILTWKGEYALDGCGFFITIDGKEYKPDNETTIDPIHKYASTLVEVEYKLLNKKIESSCGDSPEPISTDGINIVSLRKY